MGVEPTPKQNAGLANAARSVSRLLARKGAKLRILGVLGAAFFSVACVGASEPTAHHQGGYDLQQTALTFTPNIQLHSIDALQVTRLRAETALRELRFDANALSIDSAEANGQAMTWRADDSALVLVLPRAFSAGETIELRIHYHGVPARGLLFEEGVYYTSYFSCDWMFCALDRPGDKFRFSAVAIADGSVRKFSSDERQDYPAYVQGFGGGALREIHERAGAVELVYASAHASEADLRAMFASTPQMLRFFEERAGVAFPHRTFTQLLVRADEAQEAAGFTILGDALVRPILENPHEDWAIAHELAHQYWGNLLTCEDWSEFWLNEGLTTFMVAAWKQHRWGEEDYRREIDLAQQRWARAREAGWDRPLAFSGPYPDLRTRRSIQYSKGMLFLVTLRRELGEEAFWRGLRTYTRAHAGGTVESADLERAMEAASGRDLGALFAEWVYE